MAIPFLIFSIPLAIMIILLLGVYPMNFWRIVEILELHNTPPLAQRLLMKR